MGVYKNITTWRNSKIGAKVNFTHRGRFIEHVLSAMFHLVFNGHISVDTKATKRQQRDAIKRLKRCNRERHKENHTEKNICSSKVTFYNFIIYMTRVYNLFQPLEYQNS